MDAMIPMPTQTDVVAKAPQSNLRLYSGVPWDNTYQHVRLYDSQVAALSSLESYRVLYSDSRLNNMAPIRVGSLELKIPFTEMETLDLNYMTFLNKGYSNTWVFAFITSIEWLSPETTRVHFELDIWQNNIYNCTMKPCFVERMHIPKSQDTIGGNLVMILWKQGNTFAPITRNLTSVIWKSVFTLPHLRQGNGWNMVFPMACSVEHLLGTGLQRMMERLL